MTCGELARIINGEGWIAKPCKLSVVTMRGWRRHMVWRNTGLSWLPTSPKIPRAESPLYYVSTGLLGTVGGVSIGISYNRPFECVTAPWLNAQKLSRALNRYGLQGIKFHPFSIRDRKYLQQGVRLEFTDPAHAPLMALNYYALEAIKRVSGRDLFAEAIKANTDFSMFDKVNGTDATRKALQAGDSAASLVESWKAGEDAFRQRRQKYLLY
jgi:uncharacterized protein YbbC (DUF1343 family)